MKVLDLSLTNAVCKKVSAYIMRTSGVDAASICLVDEDNRIHVSMRRAEIIDLIRILVDTINEADPINGKHVFELTEQQRQGTDGILLPLSFYP